MDGKTAWRLSAMAFDASRHKHCPRLAGPILFQVGVAWFWLALSVEGRALEAWRELSTQGVPGSRLGIAAAWAHSTSELREALLKGSKWSLPLVPAWSLPDNRRMRSLGLGRMWAVLCPYCDRFHTHSPGSGRRTAHCCAHRDGSHYIVEFAGELPREHQDRFCRWIGDDMPKLLHKWAEAEEQQRAA